MVNCFKSPGRGWRAFCRGRPERPSYGPWGKYVHDPDARGIGTARYPRAVAKDEECEKELKGRTLTNLYNQRPA